MKSLQHAENYELSAFKRLTERFAVICRLEGVAVSPYRSGEPTRYESLPDLERAAIYDNFNRYLEVCNELIAGGQSMADDRHFFWRMLQRLGVHPPSDLMTMIGSGDIIEIYNAEYVQVFRNLAFFSRCSYTLDELLCRPFWELFRRDEQVTAKLLEVGGALFRHELVETYHWTMGPHSVDEIDSPARYHSVVENRVVAPLFDASGRIVAAVSTIRSLSCVATAGDRVCPESAPRG